MDYIHLLPQKESELEEIREKKNIAVKERKYEKATQLRDVEIKIEEEIFELIEKLQEYFDQTLLTNYNYDEFDAISKVLYRYKVNQNPILRKKIKSSIKDLKVQKEEALLVQNFKLRKEFNNEIEFLKKKLNEEEFILPPK